MGIKKVLAAFVLSCLGGLTLVSTAQAASPTPEQHCNVSATGELTCYASQAEALRTASGGRIDVTHTATTAQVTNAINQSNAAAPSAKAGSAVQATIIQAVMWTGTNFSGSSLNFTYSSSCSSGGTAIWNSFQAPWNDNFESAILYAGCYGRGYDFGLVSYPSGASFGFAYQGNYNSLGTFNNAMSSFKTCRSTC